MSEVRRDGLKAAKKLGGEVYEVIAEGDRQSFRILFAPEGEQDQVLLALEGFSKKTQKTPPAKIRLAQTRVAVGLTQTEVEARMGTAQSAVARRQSGASDAKLSTLERYVAALGAQLNWPIRTPASGSNRRKAKASSTVRTQAGASRASRVGPRGSAWRMTRRSIGPRSS